MDAWTHGRRDAGTQGRMDHGHGDASPTDNEGNSI